MKVITEHKNVLMFLLSLLLAIKLAAWPSFKEFLLGLGGLSYLGAFLGGALFISSFTVSMGVIILWMLAADLNLWLLGIVAGLGAMMGDFLILRFLKNGLIEEVKPLYESVGGGSLFHVYKFLIKSKYFKWLLPFLGALIIASPLPDEIGIAMLGISKMKTAKFLALTFILNTVGIFLLLSTAFIAQR